MHTSDVVVRTLRKVVQNKAFMALLALTIGMSLATPNFLTGKNLEGLLHQSVAYAILATGVTLTIISAACDLSIGGVMCLAGVITIGLYPMVPTWVAALVAIAVGGAIGFVNGFLAVHQKTEPFIITLGMGLLLRGVNLQLTNGRSMPGRDPGLMTLGHMEVLGIPVVVLIAVALVVFFHLLMSRTSYGRNLYALGGDWDVAVYSGINAVRHQWIAFVISGMTAAIGGIMLSARLYSASAIYGDNTAYVVNASVVIGGTSFAGGIGGILPSIVGVVLFNAIENAMNLLALGSYTQQTIMGVLIVAIIGMELYSIKRRREKV